MLDSGKTWRASPATAIVRLVELIARRHTDRQDNRLVFLNPAAMRLFGASAPEQILGKSPFDVFHPDSHALIRERIGRMMSGQPCRRRKRRSCGWTAA